jgi:hypothetical protein
MMAFVYTLDAIDTVFSYQKTLLQPAVTPAITTRDLQLIPQKWILI